MKQTLIGSVSTYHIYSRPVSRVVGACLLFFFHSRLFGFDSPSFFSSATCHILSGPLCFVPLPTGCLYLPSLLPGCSVRGDTADLMSGGGFPPRLQAPPTLMTARTFKAEQMFHIPAYIALDPRRLMNYSLCFSVARSARDRVRGVG